MFCIIIIIIIWYIDSVSTLDDWWLSGLEWFYNTTVASFFLHFILNKSWNYWKDFELTLIVPRIVQLVCFSATTMFVA